MRLFPSVALLALSLAVPAGALLAADEAKQKCPVSGHEVKAGDKVPVVFVNGQKVSFCCPACPAVFAANPEKYITDAGKCPVAGGAAKATRADRIVLNNDLFYTCCAGCPEKFTANPAQFVKKLKDPVTGKSFAPKADSPRVVVSGQIYLFASADSKAAFEKDSAKYVVLYK
jgi:YHS domain-containing protein